MGSYWSSPPPTPPPAEQPPASVPIELKVDDGVVCVVRRGVLRKRARGDLLCPVCLQVPAEPGAVIHRLLDAVIAIWIPVCRDCAWQLPDAVPEDRCACCTTRPAVGTLSRLDSGQNARMCERCLDATWVSQLLTTQLLGVTASRPPTRKRKSTPPPQENKKLSAQCTVCTGRAAARCNEGDCTATLCVVCLRRRHGAMAQFYENSTVWRCAEHAK